MLNQKMSLYEMMYYKPKDEDMLNLPNEVLVYIKVFVTSDKQEKNNEFVRFIKDEGVMEDLYEPLQTDFYVFNSPDKTRNVTIFELYSKTQYYEISEHFMEIMRKYNHDCDVVIDFFTHDDHFHRLSDLAGEIKLDDIN